MTTSSVNVTISSQAQWGASATTSWSTLGSWQDAISGVTVAAPGVRGMTGDTVLFAGATGNTASLDGASPTLAGITFNSTATGYTIAQGSGGTITLQAGGGAAVNVLAGTHHIAAPLNLASDTTFAVSSGSLTLSQDISGSGCLTKTGAGILNLSNSNGYGGGVTVAAGTVVVGNVNSLADGSNLTVGDANYFAGLAPSSSVAAAAAIRPASSLTTPSPAKKHAVSASPGRAAESQVVTETAPAPTVSARAAPAAQWLPPAFDSIAAAGPIEGPSTDQNVHARDVIFRDFGRNGWFP